MNPAPIAARFDCPVVSDLRQADLAAGGQGAPITPIADWILFRDRRKSRAIVNLGGFCNVTILPQHKEKQVDSHRRAEGLGLVIVTHHLAEVWEVATRLAVLVEGRWVCDQPKSGPLEAFLPRYREWIGA